MEYSLQQLSDIEYRVVQIKRRIAELKGQLSHMYNNDKSDLMSESSKTLTTRDQSYSSEQSLSSQNQRASELNNLRQKLTSK